MAGIRVPGEQYEAPTPEPNVAEVPLPKQPVANANDFGAAQAAAGEQAGSKVQGAVSDLAKDLIEQKAWSQTSQAFQNREVLNEAASKLMDDTDTHTVTNADGSTREVPNGYGLRTGQDKVDPAVLKAQLQELQQKLTPDGGWLNSVAKVNARYTDEVISSSYNKLDAYNKDQYKRDTATAFQNAYSKALVNSSDQPNMAAAVHYTQAPLFNMLANGQVAPKDHIPAQEKNALDTMNNFAQNNIGKMTADQLKAQVDDAQKAAGGIITDDIKNQAYGTIDKLNDAYQKQQKINQEHDQADSVNEFASGVGSGKYNASNANAILADKNLPANVGQALYNAVMNVSGKREELPKGIEKGLTPEELKAAQEAQPLTEDSLNLKLTTANREEAKQASTYTLAIANSLNTKDAADKLVTAIKDDKLDKTQLEVYTRTLALVGQYAPTQTEAGDGKTIDPKGSPQIAGLKEITSMGMNIGLTDLSHVKQYHDNNDKKMAVPDNIADVKSTIANKISPSTVETGTPNMMIPSEGKKASVLHFSLSTNIAPHIIFKPKAQAKSSTSEKKPNE